HRIAEPPQFVAFELADSVLSADRTVPLGDEVVDESADRLAHRFFPLPRNRAGWREDMKMDIAITEMAERNRLGAGEARFDVGHRCGYEFRHSGHGNRNVVLHSRAKGAFGRSDLVAQEPELLGLAYVGSYRSIFHQSDFDGAFEQILSLARKRRGALAVGRKLNERVPFVRALQRRPAARHMSQDGLQAVTWQAFEPLKRAARAILGVEQ